MMTQTGFNFSLPTTVRFGAGVVGDAGGACIALGMRRVLVVTDKGVVRAGLLDLVRASLKKAGIQVEIYDGVHSNPVVADVDEAACMAEAGECDGLLALGGGSPMDTAKGAAVVLAGGGGCDQYLGVLNPRVEPLPIVALPSTAGTGSEVTKWAVISQPEQELKSWIGGDALIPKVALLDPKLTFSLPADLTIYTALDALTHAIGALTSTYSNPMADALALAAIRRIAKSLQRAVESPRDQAARSDLLVASTMAGAAFNSGRLVAVHCISEALGGKYDLHHGLLNAIILPHVMAFNAPAVPEKFSQIAVALGYGDEDGVAAINQFLDPFELPSLRGLGVSEEIFPQMVEGALEACADGRNPRALDKRGVLEVLSDAY
jgi:alcohol dehydrogenase class IV